MIKFTSLLVLTVALSSANTITWVTAPGAVTPGLNGVSVNASATVVTAAGNITVTLTNLLDKPKSAGQLVSDFEFTLNATPTALDADSTPSGNLIDISSAGVATPSIEAIQPWLLTSTGATILLERLGGPDTPSQTIIGPGPYTNANNSIAGNDSHNPFLDGTATFTFAVAGVTANTSVTAARFSFGTEKDVYVPGILVCSDCDPVGHGGGEVPEPFSAFLIAGGLLGVGIFGKFRRA